MEFEPALLLFYCDIRREPAISPIKVEPRSQQRIYVLNKECSANLTKSRLLRRATVYVNHSLSSIIDIFLRQEVTAAEISASLGDFCPNHDRRCDHNHRQQAYFVHVPRVRTQSPLTKHILCAGHQCVRNHRQRRWLHSRAVATNTGTDHKCEHNHRW